MTRRIFKNTAYFLREAGLMLKQNLLSHFFSLCSTALVFFILAMVLSGWWAGSHLIEAIKSQEEINVYYKEGMEETRLAGLTERIKALEGVVEAVTVDEEEAYGRMAEILGKDAAVLSVLEKNPFEAFIEVRIDVERMDDILRQLSAMPDIDYLRDNREILDRIQGIVRLLGILGTIVVGAAGITTLVTVSHLIRLGIQNNKEQIHTLRLLGAPEAFIGLPYLLVGLFLTAAGGLLAIGLMAWVLHIIYGHMAGPFPFLPLMPQSLLIGRMAATVGLLSVALGLAGSLAGLKSQNKR
jgi:cell division transport system permease protein